MLQDRINKISEYFRGMEITNNTYIVRVSFKDRWGVFPSEEKGIKVCKSEEVANEFFYYANYITASIDDVFDLIEETISMNIDAEMKINLLSVKMDELKMLFSSESLEKLQTLYFAFNEVSKPLTPKKRKKRKKNDETVTEEQPCVEQQEIVVENELELIENNVEITD